MFYSSNRIYSIIRADLETLWTINLGYSPTSCKFAINFDYNKRDNLNTRYAFYVEMNMIINPYILSRCLSSAKQSPWC